MRLLGIPFRLNPLFLLILLVQGLADAADRALVLLAAVLLHELAHAVVACGYGLVVDEAAILPFGGVARTGIYGTPRARLPETEILAGLARHGPAIAVGRPVRGGGTAPATEPAAAPTIR